MESSEKECSAENGGNESEKVILFTTKVCPNCPRAKEELKDIDVEHLDAHENMELTQKYGIRTVPAQVVIDGGQHKKYSGINDIIRFKNERKDA